MWGWRLLLCAQPIRKFGFGSICYRPDGRNDFKRNQCFITFQKRKEQERSPGGTVQPLLGLWLCPEVGKSTEVCNGTEILWDAKQCLVFISTTVMSQLAAGFVQVRKFFLLHSGCWKNCYQLWQSTIWLVDGCAGKVLRCILDNWPISKTKFLIVDATSLMAFHNHSPN